MTGLERLVEEAKTELVSFFRRKSDERTDEARKDARICSSLLATHAKMVQAESGMAMVNLSFARDIAENKDELIRLIRAALPDNRMLKALPSKKVKK